MADDKGPNTSTAVLVALIGTAGVLGGALIGNWDKIFPRPTPPLETRAAGPAPTQPTAPDASSTKAAAAAAPGPAGPGPESSGAPKAPPIAPTAPATPVAAAPPAAPAPKPSSSGTSHVAPPAGEDCIAFDPATAKVEYSGGRWGLSTDGGFLESFESEALAQRSVSAVRTYDLHLVCFVGRGRPTLEYYLNADGELPSGAYPGESCMPMNPDGMQSRQIGDHWGVLDPARKGYLWSPNQAEAQRAVEMIRKYRPTMRCLFGGSPDAGQYLRR
jgi:hypothetical protein